MSEQKIDNTSSFYPTGIDNSEDFEALDEATRPTPTPEEIFLREIHQLTDRGPFMGDSGKVAIRAFSYKEVTLFGFLVEETADAFIVLLPASLARDDQGVKATQVIASPTARLMKTSVGIMSLPTPVQTLYYLSLISKQLSTCPGYFTAARTLQINNLIGLLKIALGVKELNGTSKASKTKVVSVETKETFQVPDHLTPRIKH